jgi:hypothetical protein
MPYITGGGWWGLALGWIVGLVAVYVHSRGLPTRGATAR